MSKQSAQVIFPIKSSSFILYSLSLVLDFARFERNFFGYHTNVIPWSILKAHFGARGESASCEEHSDASTPHGHNVPVFWVTYWRMPRLTICAPFFNNRF